ncbi:MAG: carboxypeptidase-like regulatory domain-containing protein [Rikenellaceae bacterium]|nr:carboxypeptidase-like regulatory domain-containing protein [Rikenellaceae bacterium]
MKLQTIKLKGILKAAALFCAVSVIAVGCNEKHAEYPPVTPGAATYEINGYVTKSGSTTRLDDVKVTYSSPTSRSASTTTNSDGYFEFVGLSEYGTYNLTFERDGYSTNYQTVTFTQGSTGENKVQSVNVSLSELPENGTSVDPSVGGTVPIEGNISGEIIVPAGTTVRNANNEVVTGPIEFYANEVSDITTANDDSYAPIAVVDLLPNGYTFSPSLTLQIDNPMNTYHFNDVILQYFNPSTGKWQTQSQAVTYEDGHYIANISHSSIYKIAINSEVATTNANEALEVMDSIRDNSNSIEPLNVTSATVYKLSGYRYVNSIAAALEEAGITVETTTITTQLENVIKKYLKITTDPSYEFLSTPTAMNINQTVNPGYILKIRANQDIMTYTFTFDLRNTNNTSHTVTVVVEKAGDSVSINPVLVDGNDHGTGGGGSN